MVKVLTKEVNWNCMTYLTKKGDSKERTEWGKDMGYTENKQQMTDINLAISTTKLNMSG